MADFDTALNLVGSGVRVATGYLGGAGVQGAGALSPSQADTRIVNQITEFIRQVFDRLNAGERNQAQLQQWLDQLNAMEAAARRSFQRAASAQNLTMTTLIPNLRTQLASILRGLGGVSGTVASVSDAVSNIVSGSPQTPAQTVLLWAIPIGAILLAVWFFKRPKP